MLAGQLGYIVEGFQAAFPDCQAKRRIGSDIWQHVTIEFEYKLDLALLRGVLPGQGWVVP